MSRDRREEVLARIEQILIEMATGIDGLNVYRDRAEFEVEELPALVLLDGTEETEIKSKDKRGPQIMRLLTQIFYVPIPPENQLNVGIGPLLSDYRVRMIKAVMTDYPLKDLIGDNGYVEYRGMETDMQSGGEVKGQSRIDFAFAYVLNFNEL